MRVVNNILNRFFTNTNVKVCENKNSGRATLMSFLSELEHRTFLLKDCKNAREFDLMTIALKDVLKLAVNEWDTFANSYDVTIGFSDSVTTSNVFTLKVVEKNGCPRSWEFRFNNLIRP